MKDARELISKWGTVAKFADATEQPYERASQWHKRNCIAPEHFSAVISAAREKGLVGVSFEFLHKIRSEELKRRRDASKEAA